MSTRKLTTSSGMVLIVVVAILAALSLMGITFVTLMRLETAATQNRVEMAMARRAAWEGVRYAMLKIGEDPANVDSLSDGWHAPCPSPSNPYFCQQTERRGPLIAGFALHNHNSGSLNNLYRGPQIQNRYPHAASISDEGRRFNINLMGWREDQGPTVNPSQRLSSVEASLVRLIESKLTGIYASGDQHNKAVLLARAIVEHRSGPDARPGQAGFDDHVAEQSPGWRVDMWNSATDDNGIGLPSDSNDLKEIGWHDMLPNGIRAPDGTPYVEEHVFPYVYKVWSSTANSVDVQPNLNWPNNLWNGHIVVVTQGPGAGQVRLITNTTLGYRLHVSPNWSTNPVQDQSIIEIREPDEPYEIGLPRKALARGKVASAGSTSLTVADPNPNWNPSDRWKGCYVRIVKGTGTGQERRITASGINTLTIDPAWSQNPSSDSYFEIYGTGRSPFYAGDVASGTPNGLIAAGSPAWTTDQWVNYHAIIVGGTGQGQSRRITSNSGSQLTITPGWNVQPDSNSKFEIVAVSEDKPFSNLDEIIGVMQAALIGDGESADTARQNAEKIFYAIRDSISVLSYENAGYPWAKDGIDNNANGQTDEAAEAIPYTQDRVSINDWALDRLDNDGDGLIDEEDEAIPTDDPSNASFDQTKLNNWLINFRRLLGLSRVGATETFNYGLTREQANKLVANIYDFRDDNDIPVKFEDSGVTVYGSEGLHITEFMAVPDPVTSKTVPKGQELTDDGMGGTYQDNPPVGPLGWDWNTANQRWEQNDPTVIPPATVKGIWTFDNTRGHDLKDGWYAIKIYGTAAGGSNPIYKVKVNGIPSDGVDIASKLGSGGSCYLRNFTGDGKLTAVYVSSGTMVIEIEATQGSAFEKFELFPQFVEITNIAMHSPRRASTHGIDLSKTNGAVNPWKLKIGSLEEIPIGEAYYYNPNKPGGPGRDTTTIIPAASGNGIFPVDYGFFVIALSEEAYAKYYGKFSSPDTAPNTIWGDHPDENYPVFFVGDTGADEAARNANAEKFKIPLTDVTIKLTDGNGTLIAGGDIDGLTNLSATAFTSKEKTDVLGVAWADYESPPTRLCASQNMQLTVPADPTRGTAATTIFSCLNKNYTSLYNGATGYPNFKTMTELAAAHITFPIILNRPYASPGWLGLVPSGTPWRTIDPDPNDPPAVPHGLLGRLAERAVVGGIYSRININTADKKGEDGSDDGDRPVLKALFSDAIASAIQSSANRPWRNLDALMTEDFATTGSYSANNREDSGAGTYIDDFPDDSDEKEEWFRRYANLIVLRSNVFRVVSCGAVFLEGQTTPIAQCRIEAFIDRGTDVDGDGRPDVRILSVRYLNEY